MILKNKPIDPHDCETLDIKTIPHRLRTTIDFIDEIKEPVLDIGEPNAFGQAVAEHFKLRQLNNTKGDLNFEWEFDPKRYNSYNTIFIFEVIEHLLNPAYLLEEIKYYCAKDAVVYITYPIRPHLFWTHCHFHEYDRKRFLYLLDYCGYKVEKYQWKWERDGYNLKFLFSGIRPLLFRWWIGRTRRQYYKVVQK